MRWSIYEDIVGEPVETDLTEQEARSVLELNPTSNLYAQNIVGDFIETHDGPVVICRSKS